ncbi:MAG: hypothetical protein ACFCGT_03265 [Sandaracinaceae bacterium]
MPGDPTCMRDDQGEPAGALPLEEGMAAGFLCPLEDKDWYRLTVGPADRLVNISLSVATMRSPVEPTYTIWTANGDEPGEAVAGPEPSAVGGPLDDVHCLSPGEHLIVVRDQNEDAQDLRNPYTLTVSTAPEPDGLEPNDEAIAATPLPLGMEAEGYVGCRGDEDWYVVDVPADNVLRLRLESEVATYEPTVRLYNASGEQVLSQTNLRGMTDPTFIDLFRVLPTGGLWYVVVSDDNDQEADFEVPYRVLVEAVPDVDPGEPNDTPADATPLAEATCGGGWTDWVEMTGTIGSPSDNDWFELPLTNCTGGLLEAELRVHGGGLAAEPAWALQEEVQASLTVVTEDSRSPCGMDTDCRVLNRVCEDQWDCERVFNACATEGLCVGAAVCLPGGICGANQIERHYERRMTPSPVTGPPPSNEAIVSTPIFRGNRLYLRVSDFQADGGQPDPIYTLRYRFRLDPDAGDRGTNPNNLYGQRLLSDLPVSESQDRAVPIAAQPPGGCGAGSAGWFEGSIGYENDLDWFVYDHPCPGADCMVAVHYEVDGGPVEHFLALYTGSRQWFTFELGQGASGTFGGLDPDDQCVYAYFEHSQPYYVLVRDIAEPSRDWQAEQTYRVCIERAADGCQAPCMDFGETGCGQP